MEAYSLLELNNYIKRVIALNFEEAIWIECEISSVSEVRGQVYIDLVQKDPDTQVIVAQSRAAIWYKANLFIKKKLKDLYDSILTQGIKIKCKVEVTFHERYSMSLSIVDVDASYTLGNLEMERQKIISELKAQGLFETNKEVPLTKTIRNVAVISSSTAAGYIDFTNQLSSNVYAYKYQVSLFQSAMQGANTESDVCDALYKIQNGYTQYDCIVITRGGGSKLDLSFFDSKKIGEAIATSTIPVITGIGHEIDLSIADLVAHTYLKTPTAIANFIIDRTLMFESECLSVFASILQQAQGKLKEKNNEIETASKTLNYLTQRRVLRAEQQLKQLEHTIHSSTKHKLSTLHQQLNNVDTLLTSYDPKSVLKRGYAIASQGGKTKVTAKSIKKGELQIQFQDGIVDVIKG